MLKPPPPETRTPCGYRPGPLKASDGTRYVVEVSGQIRRLERKMGKADAKRSAGGTPAPRDACATVGATRRVAREGIDP